MKIQHTRSSRVVLALSAALSLAFVAGCGADPQDTGDNSASRTLSERSAEKGSSSFSSQERNSSMPGAHRPGVKAPERQRLQVDWAAFVRDPSNYLLSGAQFPSGYVPRTLSLAERGKAIQDVGRAGVSVENFPSSCNGAGGRIGSPNDQIAVQMASKQNHSLTLVVINNENPNAAVAAWSNQNDQCSTFLSQENGVTSTVFIEKTDTPDVPGGKAVGYLVTTKTTNLRGSTTQEQLLYAVPMGQVVVEVMGMNFGGPVNRAEVDAVLREAVDKSSEVEAKAAKEQKNDKAADKSAAKATEKKAEKKPSGKDSSDFQKDKKDAGDRDAD